MSCLFPSQQIICAAVSCQWNAWTATVCQGKAGWSSHEALPMILSWQPFVPAARHGNVTFAAGGSYKVRAQCDCHTPRGPNTMWRGKAAHPKKHQDLIIWPFPFRIDLFSCIMSKITFYLCCCENWLRAVGVHWKVRQTFAQQTSLLNVWVNVWSDYLVPTATMSPTKNFKLIYEKQHRQAAQTTLRGTHQ